LISSTQEKMRSEVNLPSVSSSSEMQWRRDNLIYRLLTVSTKTDRDKNAPTNRR
jgi:hypothetical protein